MEDCLTKNETHYLTIFENSPVSFWEEDFSDVKIYIDALREKGVSDLRTYFDEHPEDLMHCYTLVKVLDVNKATLRRYEAKSKEELLKGVSLVFTEQSHAILKEELIAFSEGNTTFQSEMFGKTLKGGDLHTEIFLTIVPGHEETWEKVLICDVDISKRKRLEMELKNRSDQQGALAQLSQTFLKEIDLQQCLDKAICIVEQTLELEFTVVLQCHNDPEILSLRAATDFAQSMGDAENIAIEKDSLFGYSLHSGTAVIVDDWYTERRFTCPTLFADRKLVSGLSVLIGNQENPLGILAAFSSEHRIISRNEVNFLEAVSRLLTMGMEKEKIKEQQTRLVAAIDQTAELVVITDSQGNIQYVNPVFVNITGFPDDHILGKNIISLNSGSDNDSVIEELRKDMRSNKVWNGHFINQKKDGSLLTLEVTISPVRDKAHRTVNFVAVLRDITEYLELENRLRHSQKIQAIGTLAGGIAHDFNNILAGIIGFTDLAEDCVPEEGELYDILSEIKLGAHRAKELVDQILTFSRQGSQTWKPLKIQSIVQEAINLLRNAIPVTIAINCEISSDCGIIQGNESQIHQVIINLCSNGYQAMLKKGGTLEIRLEEIRLDAKTARAKDLKKGNYARLLVSDTGHGMDEATMARIFEPYFTTKDVSLGTGLGLSTVLGIVESHGGKVSVESIPDEGSKFEVLIPIFTLKRDDSVNGRKVEEKVDLHPIGNGEHILFIDDEEPIIKFSRAALKKYGYRVTAIACSEEALNTFRAQPNSFDLVVTDQIMPKMTGMELARQILEIRPEVPIILSTGFSEGVDREEVHSAGLSDFYLKPISSKELSQRIRRALAD